MTSRDGITAAGESIPDEGSHDLLIQKNLVYRCQDGALFAHHNHNITAENNIFAFNRVAQVERGGIGGFELTFRRNLVYFTEGKAVGDYGAEHCGATCARFDAILYWNATGKPVLFATKSFAEWQAIGQDKQSLIVDPLFVDPQKADFRLRPQSPATRYPLRGMELLGGGATSQVDERQMRLFHLRPNRVGGSGHAEETPIHPSACANENRVQTDGQQGICRGRP